MIVIDASALLEMLLQGPLAGQVAARVSGHVRALHVPHLVDLEICQVLRRFALRNEISVARATQALADFHQLALVRHPHFPLLQAIWSMRENATAYDASYLALAEALDATLLTCDRGLASVPGYRDRVDLVR
ncbi:MAG: type II toxin-antitoxin system VapC family toxin [Burkholderiaceae bacterium]